MPVVVIATKNSSYEKVVSNIQEVKARKGKIIAIVTEGDVDVRKMADYTIEIPKLTIFLYHCKCNSLAVVKLSYCSYAWL